ncbi:MAG TPA: M20/M25/M40 family metallo-hydrolase, partial [Myxococcaceae bacterium]|nr:M20/M25/M40 family metallo-hydrolase [Myxococcaceae bacterium]
DTTLEISGQGPERLLTAKGRAAHAGVGLVRGRNAVVALAVAVHGRLPPSAAADLLEYTRVAGADTRGRGLGLTLADPLWGAVDTNFGQVKRGESGRLELHVNLRSGPALWGEALKARVDAHAKAFAAARGGRFELGGQFGDEPFVVPAEAPLVQRLLAAYTRATGHPAKPVVSAGGTYARRMTNAIAFGMWFREDGVYPGHNSDEKMPIRSLERGMHVLAEALADLATGPRIAHPLEAPAATRR